LIVFCIFAACSVPVVAEPATYPSIGRLSPGDILFRQIQDSVSQGYKAELGAAVYPDLFLCSWTALAGDDLFSLAARFSLPYETLATLNGIGRPRAFEPGETVLVPSVAGVFVPDIFRNDLDILLSARLRTDDPRSKRVSIIVLGKEVWFTFYQGARLYQTERSFFLDIGFRMPLAEGTPSSSFGMRISPIDGHDRMHDGLDIAAPAGSTVVAAREGTVIAVGTESVLGIRVIIDHGGGLKTVYGHLQYASVVLNQSVRSGTMIGAVGSTGLSTGPHLHFEIRLSGEAKDPSRYLPGLKP